MSVHGALLVSLWYVINALLHDIAVLSAHKGPYDRELLRLLMDGHILLLSGAIVFVCYLMMLNKIQCGATINIFVAAFMLLYCLMIFPFLPAYVTALLSLYLIVLSIKALRIFPDIYRIMQVYR